MNPQDKYLPIGTVVLLKGANKRLMIVGFCTAEENNKEKVWDYNACLYPEGVLKSNQSVMFNHDQIEKIYHLGLIDVEEELFKKELNKALNKMNNSEEKTQEITENKIEG